MYKSNSIIILYPPLYVFVIKINNIFLSPRVNNIVSFYKISILYFNKKKVK